MGWAALNEHMRSFFTVGSLGLLLLAGCAETKTEAPNFGNVPGPSQPNATLPAPPAVAPVPPKPAPAGKKPIAPKEKKPAPANKTPADIVTPNTLLVGKVARFNEAGRFVVLEFPIAHMPGKGQKLFIYREGLKIGEVKITGPQRDDRTVADVTTGEARVGDEVREQ